MGTYNFGMLALQAAGLDANDPSQSLQIEMNREMLAVQAAGLGPEFKTASGHVAYPYAATLDPTGTSGQTAFDFVGDGVARDENGEGYYGILILDHGIHTACEQDCLARSAEVHGLVGYSWIQYACRCLYDAAVAYPERDWGASYIGRDIPTGTGRMTLLTPENTDYQISERGETYERVYVL